MLQPVWQFQRRERLWGQRIPIYGPLRTRIDKEIRRKAGQSPAYLRGRSFWHRDSISPPLEYRGWRGNWRRRTCRSRSGRRIGNRPHGSVRPGSRRSPRTYQSNVSGYITFFSETAEGRGRRPRPRPVPAAWSYRSQSFFRLCFSFDDRPASERTGLRSRFSGRAHLRGFFLIQSSSFSGVEMSVPWSFK